jgi:cytochrome P450
MSMYLIAHPDHIQQVLKTNNKNYVVKRPSMHLTAMMGNGLTLSKGDLWLRQRWLVQPAFHRSKIRELAQLTSATIATVLDGWMVPPAGPNGDDGAAAVVDVAREMERLSFTVLLTTLFGSSLGREETDRITEAVELVLRAAGRGLFLEVPPLVPTPENLRIRRALGSLRAAVGRIIAKERRSPSGRTTLLSLLLEARDEETGAAMTEQQLYDEVISIFVAGYETTAVAMAWALHMLAQHPAVQQRLHSESRAMLAGRPIGFDDLTGLPYLGQVVSESMRIYPPFWAMTRQVVADDIVGGYRIPKGALVVVSPYVTHRHPGFWKDPTRFDPDRFGAAQSEARHKLAYFPFGAGPRFCIGERNGQLTTLLTVATIIERFSLSPVPDHEVRIHAAMTMRPKDGIRLRLARRA